MLLDIFREHNKKYRVLIGKDVVEATVLRYERAVRYLEEVLKKEYKVNDIPLGNINHQFVEEFEYFNKTKKLCTKCDRQILKDIKENITQASTNK